MTVGKKKKKFSKIFLRQNPSLAQFGADCTDWEKVEKKKFFFFSKSPGKKIF